MNELEILRDAWGAPDGPSPAARTTARASLLARRRPRRRRATVMRLAVAGACAAAVAAGATLVVNVGGIREDAGVPIAAADVLERAAVAAEQQPFTPPRDDQWIYTEHRITGSRGEPRTVANWRRADGGGMAWIEDGKLRVMETEKPAVRAPRLLDPSYKSLAALPTDPDALLRLAYEAAEDITGAGVTEHGDVYQIFNDMLRSYLLPPDLTAAIYRAIAQLPNVTVETVDVFGGPALALTQSEDWLREELLFDPETYAYRGERAMIVRDATISPEKAGNATGEVKRGGHVTAERVTTAIVDEPGERP
jgi:hypothetical protein